MVIHSARDEKSGMRVACLDTAADVNVISLHVVESLQIPMEQYQGPRLKVFKDIYLPNWQVTYDWHVAKFYRTYTSTFVVVGKDRSRDFDILLGEKSIKDIGFYQVNCNIW